MRVCIRCKSKKAIKGSKSSEGVVCEACLAIETTKDIYKPDKTLNYAGFKGVKFLRKEMIRGIEHVVMLDSFGNEKKVYTDLFEKYARVVG